MSGALAPNERLSKTEKLFENKLFGPESVAAFNGRLVTGCGDGFLYQIDGNTVKPILKLVEKSCATNPHTTKCGRPLGLKFDSKGTLFVVEPTFGVFSVRDIFESNPKVEWVFNIDETAVLGNTSKLLNDLAIDEGAGLEGGHVLYISDMSVKFNILQFPYLVLGSDMGRILKYDINAKKVESIAENLMIPNGLQLTDDTNSVLVDEFLMRRVLKVHIKGTKKGKTEVFIGNLPGEPDNIRRSASKKETYWLAIINARNDSSKETKLDFYLRRPLLRKVMCRLLHLFGSVIEFIGNTFNNSLFKEYGFDMKNGKQFNYIIFNEESNNYAMIIEVDINGKIVDSLQSSDTTIAPISEVREVRVNDRETVLYLGSFSNNHLGKLKLNR